MKESKRLVEDAIGKKLSFENVDEKKFQSEFDECVLENTQNLSIVGTPRF